MIRCHVPDDLTQYIEQLISEGYRISVKTTKMATKKPKKVNYIILEKLKT